MLPAKVLLADTAISKAFMRCCPFTDRGDTAWSIVKFASCLGRWPDQNAVPGFNDGLLRVKLAERNDPLRHQVADKVKFKSFATERLGIDHVVPVIDLIDSKAVLSSRQFPNRCIIKPSDASGVYKVRRNGEPVDLTLLSSFFDRNHYRFTREKFYKYIPSRLIVEELLHDGNELLPVEYKVFCFFGKAKIIQWSDRNSQTGLIKRWYTPQWRPLEFTIAKNLADIIAQPAFLADLIAAAEIMSKGFSSVRADFFVVDSRIIASELTNVDGNASRRFVPDPAAELSLGPLFTDPHVTVDDLIG